MYVNSMLDNISVFHSSVFAAQAYVESDCGSSKRYAVACRFVFRALGSCVFDGHGSSESDYCISMRYVNSMLDNIFVYHASVFFYV